MPGIDCGGSALHHLFFHIWVLFIREDLSPECKELGPGVNARTEAEVTFGKGDEGGEGDKGVGREMVRLEPEPLKEFTYEFTDGKAESPFKVGDEYNVLAEFRLGSYLGAGSSALHALRRRLSYNHCISADETSETSHVALGDPPPFPPHL